MSAKTQSTINFQTRKSSRNTNKINYNEKQIENKSIIDINVENNKKSINNKCEETKNKKKSEKRIRKPSNCDNNNKLDQNEDQLTSSPSKLKKTSNENLSSKMSLSSKTKQSLSPSIVDNIIGRDSECDQMMALIGKHLASKQSLSLYISGPAGTGKTLSVNHVVQQLQDTNAFKLIKINCMSFRNSNQIFNKILKELNVKKHSKQSDCLKKIESLLSDCKSDEMIVLLVDEIDQLETNTQKVIHNMFSWSELPNSKVILIGIANSLDFTTRTLTPLKATGLSSVQDIHFLPYSKQQIIQIIEDRMQRITGEKQNINISSDAIQFCAARIASLSGDIRKALELCRRACDLAGVETVQVQHLTSVFKEVDECSRPRQALPFKQQVILCALLSAGKGVHISECHKIFKNICSKRGFNIEENDAEFKNMCHLLEDNGLVTITKTMRNSTISLKIDKSMVNHMLSEKTLLKTILTQSSLQNSN